MELNGSIISITTDPEDEKYENFHKEFNKDDFNELIDELLNKYQSLQKMYDDYVPKEIDDKLFWSRYIFRYNEIMEEDKKRKEALQEVLQTAEVDENLGWGDDDDDGNNNEEGDGKREGGEEGNNNGDESNNNGEEPKIELQECLEEIEYVEEDKEEIPKKEDEIVNETKKDDKEEEEDFKLDVELPEEIKKEIPKKDILKEDDDWADWD